MPTLDFPGMLLKVGDTWHYQLTLPGNRKVRRTTRCADYNRAVVKARELYTKMQLLIANSDELPTLSGAVARSILRLEKTISERQAERAGGALRKFQEWAGDCKLEKITTDALEKYMEYRAEKGVVTVKKGKDGTIQKSFKGCSTGTLKKDLSFICSMLKEEGYTVEKPKIHIHKETRGRPFTREELRMFLDASSKYPQGDPGRYTPFWLFLLATGARPAELVPSHLNRSAHIPLLKKEIDLEREQVTIRGAKNKRGEHSKFTVIPVSRALLELCLEKAPEGEYVFPSFDIADAFDSILELTKERDVVNDKGKIRIKAETGIIKVDKLKEKLTAHSFRHTYGTMLAEAGASAFIIQAILRHADPRMTARYLAHARPQVEVVDVSEFLPHSVPEMVTVEKAGNE